MKKYFILFCLLISVSTKAQWIQVWFPLENVISLTANSNGVFAGTQFGGVYKTTNMGTNWYQTHKPFAYAGALTVNENYIYTGAAPGGLFYTTNDGTNWIQSSLNFLVPWSIAANGNNVFAGTNSGVYSSSNFGKDWSQTYLNNQTVFSILIKGSYIYAGTDSNGIFLTTNNGSNWDQTSLNNKTVLSLAISDQNILAGTNDSGVYISTNDGISWSHTSLNDKSIISLLGYQNYIFAGSLYNLYVSSDNGVNWISRNENLFGFICSLTIFNGYIFAAAEDFTVFKRPLNELIGLKSISDKIPKFYNLLQNYPNPFNPVTNIKFDIPVGNGRDRSVKLIVYDLLGREIITLVNQQMKPGSYNVDWDASNYSSGVYFYKIEAGDPSTGSGRSFVVSRKMVLVK